MNVVIPMAGRGSRFVEAGETVPKPLIPVGGRPMYSWAVDSLPLSGADKVIFLCLREHLANLSIEHDIRSRYGTYRPLVMPVERVTEGQACTVLLAREAIANSTPLLIFNSDTYLSKGVGTDIRTVGASVDGLLGVFRAPGDQWSFVRVDPDGRVIETAEKRRISEWASTGMYYFARGSDFVRHADAMLAAKERVRGEFFVAPVFNRMIASGMDIRITITPEVWALGTPQDLARFQASGISEAGGGPVEP